MRRLGLALILLLTAGSVSADGCSPNKVSLRGDWGQAAFNVEIADTPEKHMLGLMYRETLSARSGMLFVYDFPRSVSFWMRNTLIPLDMIFAAQDGTIRAVHHMAQPLDETIIPGGTDIQYVLEINGGISKLMGIVPGSQMQHPLIDQDIAAWPCDN